MDKINLNKFIHSKNSYERFPVSKDHLENTGITFNYSKPIRNKITNYNYTVNNPKLIVSVTSTQILLMKTMVMS